MDSDIRPFVLCTFIAYKPKLIRNNCSRESILSNCLDGFRDIDIRRSISVKRLIRNCRDRLAAQLRRDDNVFRRTGVAGNRRFVARYGVCKAVGLLNGADDICVQQWGISLANVLLQRIPILLCAAVIYGCQSSTIVKSTRSNARHTLWNRHFRQAAASPKNTLSNARHTFRNDYFCQAAAIRKSTGFNARHTLWNRHFRQTAAIPKSTISNARHTFRNRYFRQAVAMCKSKSPNLRYRLATQLRRDDKVLRRTGVAGNRHAGIIFGVRKVALLRCVHNRCVLQRVVIRINIVLQCIPSVLCATVVYGFQSIADVKSRIFNALHTLWNGDFRQAGARYKSNIFNARHTFRNRYLCQAATIPKSSLSNARHTFRNLYFR